MKNTILTLLLILTVSIFSTPANARMMFGEKQDVRKLVDISLKGKEKESLYLGNLVTTHFFVLGTYLEDGGYVLGVSGERGKYYPFPDEAVITKIQDAGLLPKQLPTYKIGLFDYLFGYSLYLAIVGILLWGFISTKFKRKRAA